MDIYIRSTKHLLFMNIKKISKRRCIPEQHIHSGILRDVKPTSVGQARTRFNRMENDSENFLVWFYIGLKDY